jgi:beta-N-acetylhexosaminidase
VSAYIRGARSSGLLTAAKHFPGHGDTATDSHLGVAAVTRTHAQIEQIDLPPFRAAVEAGTDAVMVAHVTAPALDPAQGKIGTNSGPIVTDLLKNELRFSGVVITDAMDMSGLTQVYPEGGPAAAGHAAVDVVKAGNDMLLLPSDLDGAYNGLLNAARSGQIPEKRIDESVLKILRMKASVGLNRASQVDVNAISSLIASPENLAFAQQAAGSSITLVRENGRLLPLSRPTALASAPAYGAVQKEGNKLVCIIFVDDVRNDDGKQLQRELRARVPQAHFFFVDPRLASASTPEIMNAVNTAENIIAAIYLVPVPGRAVRKEGSAVVNTISMPESTAVLLHSILQVKREQTVAVSFGSPYVAGEFPAIENYVCAYSNAATSDTAVARALFGEIPFSGRLPVTIPGFASLGAGMDHPAKARVQ